MNWRKSSHSASGNCVECAPGPGIVWRKATASESGNCTEVAVVPGGQDGCAYMVAVRDSKDPAGAVLTFTPGDWLEFTRSIKAPAIA